MDRRKFRLPLVVLVATMFAATMLAAQSARALGFELGETKEQLKLDYEVSAIDHGTGRVTVVFTIADEGRLKPLTSVDFVVPNRESKDGSGPPEFSVSLATREVEGKRVARVHLKREWAERARIRLNTDTLDGQETPLTWYYHAIPLAEHLQGVEPKRK